MLPVVGHLLELDLVEVEARHPDGQEEVAWAVVPQHMEVEMEARRQLMVVLLRAVERLLTVHLLEGVEHQRGQGEAQWTGERQTHMLDLQVAEHPCPTLLQADTHHTPLLRHKIFLRDLPTRTLRLHLTIVDPHHTARLQRQLVHLHPPRPRRQQSPVVLPRSLLRPRMAEHPHHLAVNLLLLELPAMAVYPGIGPWTFGISSLKSDHLRGREQRTHAIINEELSTVVDSVYRPTTIMIQSRLWRLMIRHSERCCLQSTRVRCVRMEVVRSA